MEYFIYLVVAIVAYWIGWHVRGIIFLANISERPDHMIKMLEKIREINESEEIGLPDDAIEVETEHVNNLVYAYNKVTGEFLAQAQNLHQVMVEAAKRYPGKKFWHPELTKDTQTT
jgi:hypothetical protein